LSARPCTQHFEQLRKDTFNGDILCVNLVRGKNDDHEVMLKNRYEEMIGRLGFPWVSYKFFDFHNECHENSQPFIDFVD
jgi:hypothetical protein